MPFNPVGYSKTEKGKKKTYKSVCFFAAAKKGSPDIKGFCSNAAWCRITWHCIRWSQSNYIKTSNTVVTIFYPSPSHFEGILSACFSLVITAFQSSHPLMLNKSIPLNWFKMTKARVYIRSIIGLRNGCIYFFVCTSYQRQFKQISLKLTTFITSI